MSVEQNIALMRRWFQEVWNEGRGQTIYDLLDENCVALGQDQPGVEIHGPEGFVALYDRIRSAFPDIQIAIDDIFGVDDKVTVRWSAAMTHTGNHLGIPATKKLVRITGITITRFANEKIIQGWDNWDQLSLMQQLSASNSASAVGATQ
jgi:steroid delta-isomerase-like uncharacterized protein